MCSSAPAPMWRGETGIYPCETINSEGSICRASASASPPSITFFSLGPTEPRQPNGFSVRSHGLCLPRFWTRWICHRLLSVHRGGPEVAHAMIEANFSCIIETRLVGRNNHRMLPLPINTSSLNRLSNKRFVSVRENIFPIPNDASTWQDRWCFI